MRTLRTESTTGKNTLREKLISVCKEFVYDTKNELTRNNLACSIRYTMEQIVRDGVDDIHDFSVSFMPSPSGSLDVIVKVKKGFMTPDATTLHIRIS
jgi:hypothetical protein